MSHSNSEVIDEGREWVLSGNLRRVLAAWMITIVVIIISVKTTLYFLQFCLVFTSLVTIFLLVDIQLELKIINKKI